VISWQERASKFQQIPNTHPELPGNPSSSAKVELGKMLYFDPRLSASHAISCNSCHNIGLGGADAEPTSIGHRWQHGGRNAPTVFNAVFNHAQYWDGRAKDLEQQAGGPIINPVEMASPEPHVTEQLNGQEHQADGPLFPQRSSLASRTGSCGHGHESARDST
jgi:cytochrome c peroxidase